MSLCRNIFILFNSIANLLDTREKQYIKLEAISLEDFRATTAPYQETNDCKYDRDKNRFNERNQLASLERFKAFTTQENIEDIANDLYINELGYSDKFAELIELMYQFDNSEGEREYELAQFIVGGIRRRDPEFLHLVADVMFDYSSHTNPRFQQKLKEIAYGTTKPALRVIR